jgi:hypothetical protein
MSTPPRPSVSGTEAGLEKALAQLRSVLVAGETLEAWAVQRRLFALNRRRVLIAATSGRFIALHRGLVGGFQMQDFRWQDLRDAKITAGVFGAEIKLVTSPMSDLALSSGTSQVLTYTGLRKDQAQEVYRLAQAHDQAWREKRRVRELEEMRAKSGGFQMGQGAAQLPGNPGGSSVADPAARLQQARQMLDAKLISDSEYESIKARILSGV